VIGVSFGKNYFEVKGRPRYIIEQEIGAAATRPESAVARNRAEAFQPAENGYSRVTL